jgi:hypothetical protein
MFGTKMNRPHQGIKGLKKKSRSKKGCPQREEAKERSISRKKGPSLRPERIKKFSFYHPYILQYNINILKNQSQVKK